MKNIYYHSKDSFFEKRQISFLQILFDNGDYFPISNREVVDFVFTYYDRLITYGDGYIAHARNGQITLKIQKHYSHTYDDYFLSNTDEYKKERIKTIEERLLEGGIQYLRFFNEDNWSQMIVGSFKAEIEDDYLVIRVSPLLPDEPYESDNFYIKLQPTRKEDISSILLDFENCEFFNIYQDEIVSIDLEFDEQLDGFEIPFCRVIKGGSMILDIKETKSYRKVELFFENEDKKIYPYDLRNRLTGRKGRDLINLCHLYVTFNYCGFSVGREEKLEIVDTRPDEILNMIEKAEEKDDSYYSPFQYFVGGLAERLDDKKVKITFGVFPDEFRR